MGSLESCWGLPIWGLMAHSETIDQLPRNYLPGTFAARDC